MTEPTVQRVELGARSYDIVIGADLLRTAGSHIAKVVQTPSVIVVTDTNVADHHLPTLLSSLDAAGIAHQHIILPAGEQTKRFEQLESLLEDILARGIDRKTSLVALGGGVIGDLVGFAAAVLLRGIDFIQIPTTLLSQVDSSVGGKTGINSKSGKNLVGSFHQPRLVIADMDVLTTLPERELKAGYAEVVKYGLIDDPAFFAWLEENGTALLAGDTGLRAHAVAVSCAAKARVVAEDETEKGRRALLNLGHTFGHAFEAEAGYGGGMVHGEAVSIGMVAAFDLSVRLGLAPAEDAERVRAHLAACGLPVRVADVMKQDWHADTLRAHMSKDKKAEAGTVTFILATGIGGAHTTNQVPEDTLRAVLEEAVRPH